MADLIQRKDSRLVLDINEVDIYNYSPIKVHNITDIVAYNATAISGVVTLSTFMSSGIDIHNYNIGMVGNLNLTTSGIEKLNSFYDFNMRRGDINISGSNGVGSI